MFTIEIKPNPTTEKESPELTKDEGQLLDFCMELGLICWEAFIKTPRTLAMFLLIPSDKARAEANRLFMLGFCARMLSCPPRGPEMLDDILGPIQCDKTWRDYLKTAEGQVVLDGEAYPDTSRVILRIARFFFMQGFIAGNVAVRELMKTR